jgi:hypothetical protein
MIRANIAARLLTIIALGLALAAPVHAFPQKEWRFRVQLDDKPIGHHSFTLKLEQGGNQILQSQAEFNVSFLGIPAYRYRHNTVERWEQGCLTEIASQTRRNGQTVRLAGKKNTLEMVLATEQGEVTLAGCVMSFAYWNPEILRQTHLLNSQTGQHEAVTIAAMGEEKITVRGVPVQAMRYRITGPKNPIDLWYGADNDWLALQSTLDGGRRLRYLLK